MSLAPGTRIGPYEVAGPLGAGGMGEVYRATDTKLKRQVAIKILPPALAADTDRLARFQREAEVLASLNHPNIAAIHGLEESSGTTALVMELVEGDDLSQRIARGAIPLDEALPIAKQIAEALEAAHEQGIIHRDLKPANIKVRADGTVKVLDFGLAKALDVNASSATADAMNSPTITSPAMTQAGMILGTAAYMAPEQARGTAVDKRADVWAFGVVLWEMLTGQRLFTGATVSDTLAAVLTREPDWAALPAGTPAPIQRLLRRCLQKDRKRRLDSAAGARLEIDDALTAPSAVEGTATSPTTSASRARLAWMVAAAAVVGLLAFAVPALRHLREVVPLPPPETRVDIVTPATDDPGSFAVSPDGRQIVFVASGDGASHLWLRSLSGTTAEPLAGTDGARAPFWSPDGRSIGFFMTNAVRRLDLGGGTPEILMPFRATGSSRAAWGTDGSIVFAETPSSALTRVSVAGGVSAPATTLLPGQTGHGHPFFLPGGTRLLFTATGTPDTAGIYLTARDGTAPTRLTPVASAARFVPAADSGTGGWLLWVRAGALVARRLDVENGVLTGDPVTVAEGLATNAGTAPSVSTTGLVAYRQGGDRRRQMTWVDRSGAAKGTIGEPDGNDLSSPRVSPDGRRVVVSRTVQNNTDIWLVDGNRLSRFTFDAALDRFPSWSADGTRIVFTSTRAGSLDLYQKPAEGSGAETALVTSAGSDTASSWSADGRFLMYISTGLQTNADLWVVPTSGDRRPSVFLQTPFRELYGMFSPDGRWVAYQSDESGRPEIYVRPFIAPSGGAPTEDSRVTGPRAGEGQWQVSTAGGIMPAWRHDGKELYFLNPAGAMMAASISVSATSFVPGAPVMLFPTRIYGGGGDAQQNRQYDVAPDGRFLINTELDSAAAPITLIQNWNPEAKK